jgi:spore coat polysaccharide biosynthesis protein SpsF
MQTVTLIQARMGSSRLPGKVLMDLGGMTMLERVVRRASRARRVDLTAVVTTAEPGDDVIASMCLEQGIACFRGSELDVLDRYYQAATAYAAEVIVRVTSDCPFVDPAVIDQVILAFDRAGVDYASNTLERSYPHGLDVEVFSYKALSEAAEHAIEDHERTHVTPYIYQRPERFKLHNVTAGADYSHYRWTVDQPEDLTLARALYKALGNADDIDWQAAVEAMRQKPELAAINETVQQKGLYEG